MSEYRDLSAAVITMYRQGLTQHQIAAAAGTSQSRVSRILRRAGIATRPARFHVTHGMHRSPEYRSWQMMLARCTNPRFHAYRRYGARGVSVCERWRSFENFFAHMGQRPSRAHSLDRYPNRDGNYEPGNCRWATAEEQQQNRNDNVFTPALVRLIRRSTRSASSLARELGISISAVCDARTGKSWRNVQGGGP